MRQERSSAGEPTEAVPSDRQNVREAPDLLVHQLCLLRVKIRTIVEGVGFHDRRIDAPKLVATETWVEDPPFRGYIDAEEIGRELKRNTDRTGVGGGLCMTVALVSERGWL